MADRPYPTDAEFNAALAAAFSGISSGTIATKAEAHSVLTMTDYALDHFVPDPTPPVMVAADHKLAAAHLRAWQGGVQAMNWQNLLQVLLGLLQQWLASGGTI